MICDYGCGKEAKYTFKNGKKCCSKSFRSCVGFKNHYGMGKNHPRYGKKHTTYSKNKMSKSHTGKKLTDLQLYTARNNWKNRKHSEESKNKISKSNKGKKRTKESIERIRKSQLKSITYWKTKYPFFAKIEELREHLITKEIQVRCKNHNCPNSKEKGGWFTPTYIQLYERIRQIEKNGNDCSYLYCSYECKQKCPLYNKRISQLIKDDQIKAGHIKESLYTSEEYNIWREEVLSRANYECEFCGNKATDAHHSRPQKLEPGFILDPDYGIACCEECHYKYGHETGTECSTGNLANIICK